MEYWRGTKYRKDRLPNLPYFRVYLVGCMCAEPGPPDTRFSVPWFLRSRAWLWRCEHARSGCVCTDSKNGNVSICWAVARAGRAWLRPAWLTSEENQSGSQSPAEPSRPTIIICSPTRHAARGGGFDHWFKRWDGMGCVTPRVFKTLNIKY